MCSFTPILLTFELTGRSGPQILILNREPPKEPKDGGSPLFLHVQSNLPSVPRLPTRFSILNRSSLPCTTCPALSLLTGFLLPTLCYCARCHMGLHYSADMLVCSTCPVPRPRGASLTCPTSLQSPCTPFSASGLSSRTPTPQKDSPLRVR